ncbi:HU family DNA-binding protein [Planktotalea sp.]|uniref:HU family DNA-binding protein n=1 Tax=Planktotalea sp. TaxID=2029877 RepID=UPI0032972368
MTKAKASSTTKAKTATSKTSKTAIPKAATAPKTKAPAAKPVPAAAPKPVIVTETSPTVVDPALKKKELVDLVVERSGIKKKDAKPVVEAMLEVLGEALSDGRELNLQPMGKLKINRAKDVQGAKVLVAKIRQSTRSKEAQDASATEKAAD